MEWFIPEVKPDKWNYRQQFNNLNIVAPPAEMNVLQTGNEIVRLMKCNYPPSSEIEDKRKGPYFSILIAEFKIKLKENDNPKLLIDFIEDNIKTYNMPIELMFLVYQRLIELEPKKSNLLDFSIYLWNVGGPDWKEELGAIEKFVGEDKISEAVELAMKVDYWKY